MGEKVSKLVRYAKCEMSRRFKRDRGFVLYHQVYNREYFNSGRYLRKMPSIAVQSHTEVQDNKPGSNLSSQDIRVGLTSLFSSNPTMHVIVRYKPFFCGVNVGTGIYRSNVQES